ncbi:putative acid phosphatase [Podospora fimiseda]|uniref:Acid phosphatase n=1 Tax=Podospora fimiseda TaxID=252190 RepID=A0AAN7H4H1_9PEZI|nr:putative acid phosphatase [Podospora fimiseda]
MTGEMMRQLSWILPLGCACLEVAFASAAAGLVPGKAFDRLITIWLENQDYSKTILDASITDLARRGILLTSFYAHTHPSQPNYLAAISGDYFGNDHDDMVHIPKNVSTVVDLLETKRISWAGYFEDYPSPGYMGNYSKGSSGDDSWDYVRKHNPFVSFESVFTEGERLLQLQSFRDFQRTFKAKLVPQFVFMTPNMNNDGHNTSLKYATDWSYKFLKPLLDDKAFDEKTLIMLTFDESEDYSKPNQIVTLLLGSAVPKALKGTQDDTFYTHYSMLSTIQNNWGLPHLGRYDVGANVFKFVAEQTKYKKNRDPVNRKEVNSSVSYPGLLHSDPAKVLPIPIPNSKLIGAGGRPILDSIKSTWASAFKGDWQTPYDGSGKVFDGDEHLPEYKTAAANRP